MKCSIVFLTIFVANDWITVAGSIVKINDTGLASLPPLFALEDWTRCRRPGDLYCLVDAELISRTPSGTLDLLQEYSQQSTKHYNRSQIHRGVCVSRCTGQLHHDEEELTEHHAAVNRCINQTIWNDFGLETSVLTLNWCSRPALPGAGGAGRAGEASGTGWAGMEARALGVFVLSLVVLSVLATSLHVLGERCAKDNVITSNKYLLSFSLKKNWQILTYDRSKPLQDERMKDLACIEGIRVVAIHCVILSHVLFMYIYSYTDNPQYVEHMYDSFGWQGMLNSPLWLQAFFSISAFLPTYCALVYSERRPYTVVKGLVALATRWIRLTPTAVFALWFTMYWFPLLGAGPQWGWLVRREAEDCLNRWPFHLLYVHNHLPLGKFCMGHTWYLAVDMQLHIFGTFLLVLFLRHRGTVWPVLTALLLGSGIAAGLVAYFYDLDPIITAQAPETLRSLFAGSTLMSQLYLPSYMNLAGYVTGMGIAFILYDNQKNNVHLADNKLFSLVFHLSLVVGSCVVLGGSIFLDDRPPARWARALYAALDRTIVAVAFAIFMLGCVARCRSALRSAFSWRGFHPLGRLSYCAFLAHFIVLRLTLAADTPLRHVSALACLTLFITTSILTYLASIPICLLIELPFLQLWKALIEEVRPVAPRPASTGPATGQILSIIGRDKPFDLVANVNGRHVP